MLAAAHRILLMDDDTDTVGLLKIVLQRAGFKVATASSWEEMLDRVTEAQNRKEVFDLAILDIMMPYRSGYDAYLTLQMMLNPMPPVIFLSAKCNIDDMVKASEMGAARYLTKPTTPDKLIKTVRDVIEQRQR